MGYIRGRESEFKGFGADMPSGLSALAKQLTQSEADKQLAAAKLAAENQLRNLSGVSTVLKDSLLGSLNPAALSAEAKQLASQYSQNPLSQAAFQMYFSQASVGVENLRQYAMQFPDAATIYKAVTGGVEAAQKAFTSMMSGSNLSSIDASGVADGLNTVARVTASIRSYAAQAGVENETLNEVLDWTAVAAGCGSAIAAGAAASGWGAVAGAAVCAVSVLGKLFANLFAGKPAGDLPDPLKTPFSVFQPTKEQASVIAMDAARLASIFRYVYGFKSYAEMFGKVQHFKVNTLLRSDRYPLEGTNEPLPAVMPTMLFGMLTSTPKWYTLSGAKGFVNYVYDWEVNVGAAISALGNYGEIADPAGLLSLDKKNAFSPQPWPDACTSCEAYTNEHTFEGLRRFSELLVLFAAITRIEHRESPGLLQPWAARLPVTFYKVGDYEGHHYSAIRWTMSDAAKYPTVTGLVAGLDAGDQQAALELAYLRILAAVSYMHSVLRRGRDIGGSISSVSAGKDMVASLPALNPSDPSSRLRVPVYPKHTVQDATVVGVILKGKYQVLPTIDATVQALQNHRAAMRKIQADAQRAALVSVAQAFTRRQEAAARAGAESRMLGTGASMVSIEEISEAGCKVPAGMTSGYVDYRRVECPPGQQEYMLALRQKRATASAGGGVGGGGVGGAAVVGAAALLGLLLLKR